MRMTAAVLSLFLSAGAQAEDAQALAAEGLALIPPFQKQLMETVKAAMQAGGPLKAVEACQVQAPLIAGEHAARCGRGWRGAGDAGDCGWRALPGLSRQDAQAGIGGVA